ncbi:MAG: gamma-glutamyl-gamma-aminobutyrate hydrolase family protein, partial [Actinomycetota bacterium]|nr:gamma-glutamyl-gamma-aminobutyrate hydrolase family protein [Actinomycetota bacterium]
MKPRIGVTSSPSLHEDRFLEALDRAFVNAVIRAGGLPFVLPVLDPEEASSVLACLDGILFSGGGDVDPARYTDTASPAAQGIEPERDAYEIALAHAALDLGLPVFGICRGCQVLNVALGGTLVQHLPDVTEQQHCAKEQWAETVHTVRLLPHSRLRNVVGHDIVGVNSLHHQAVSDVGTGLRAVAWAEDGTIEAVEGMGGERLLAVQWHPELLMADASQAALFDWLVGEAGRAAP